MFQLVSSASSTETHFSLEIQIFCVNGTVFNRINCVAVGLLDGTWQIFGLENRREMQSSYYWQQILNILFVTYFMSSFYCLIFIIKDVKKKKGMCSAIHIQDTIFYRTAVALFLFLLRMSCRQKSVF
jgi:hypothetical protein